MNISETVISLVAPHECMNCSRLGKILCEPCRISELIIPPSRCYRCHAAQNQFKVCPSCRKKTVLRNVWVASEYKSLAKELVYKMKFNRAKSATDSISMAIYDCLPHLSSNTVVVHVPTSGHRMRQRGYDQSALIAKKLAKDLGLKHKTLLIRKGKLRQVGASRTERFKHLEGALIAIRKDQIKGSEILLIDDIVTTGATIEAAAKVLKDAGARTINAAVFAHA